jgi:hypothetical protein
VRCFRRASFSNPSTWRGTARGAAARDSFNNRTTSGDDRWCSKMDRIDRCARSLETKTEPFKPIIQTRGNPFATSRFAISCHRARVRVPRAFWSPSRCPIPRDRRHPRRFARIPQGARPRTEGLLVGSRCSTFNATHVRDNHYAIQTRTRPARIMTGTLVSGVSSQTHAMHRRVRQQNPASGDVSGRAAVGGRGAVVWKSAALPRSRVNARRVVVTHAQARPEPRARAVKQDAAVADLAPAQLPVEQRKVRFPLPRTVGDAGTGVQSLLRSVSRLGGHCGCAIADSRVARLDGTVASTCAARAPAHRNGARWCLFYLVPRVVIVECEAFF